MDNLNLRLKLIHCITGLLLFIISGNPFRSEAQVPIYRVQMGDNLLEKFGCLSPIPPYDPDGKMCYALPNSIRAHQHFPESTASNDSLPLILVLFEDEAEKSPQELALYINGHKASFSVHWYSDLIRVDTQPASGFVIVREKKIEQASFPLTGNSMFPISVGIDEETMVIQVHEKYTSKKSDGSYNGDGVRPLPFKILIGLYEFSIQAVTRD